MTAMTRSWRTGCSALLVGLACLVGAPPTAHADEQNAEQLFQLGLGAMKKKEYATACEAFAKSNVADPSPGTQINLALCFEKRQQWASAWAWYRSAFGLAQQRGQHERAQLAEDSANRIQPQLHYVVVAVQEPVTDLVVKRDGTEVITVLNDKPVPLPVDPGEHVFQVSAKGKKPWSKKLVIADDARTERLEVPALENAPVEAPAGDGLVSRSPSARGDGPREGSAQRTAGVIVASTGGLSALASVGVFVLANAQANRRDDNKEAAVAATGAQRISLLSSAKTYADAADNDRLIAVILAGGAGLLVATGAVLYFTAPRAAKTAATHVVPILGPGIAGVGVGGAF